LGREPKGHGLTSSQRATPLAHRRIRFEYPEGLDPLWSRRFPEFACAANGLSLMMPHVEPYVVKSVRAALDQLPPELAERTQAYLAQELAHHTQHHRFNELLRARYPGLARVERWMRVTYRWMHQHRSLRFGLAYAAGFEAVAYAAARWTESHMDELFRGAEPVPATLLLWHLAEEVEHKTVAFDVYEEAGGGRWLYAAGMVTSLVQMAWFALVAMWVMLYAEGRLFRPITHLRLVKWWLSFTFEVVPSMLASALPGHHPSGLSDPIWLTTWLRHYDPETATLPTLDGLVAE
jgi:uncharacterized protein